jgi:hypothetical protein
MKKIVFYLKEYWSRIDQRVFAFSALLTAIAIFINYYFGLNRRIIALDPGNQWICWFLVFFTAFSLPYIFKASLARTSYFIQKKFLILLFTAPALFAWKLAFNVQFHVAGNPVQNGYWNKVIYWPFKLVVFVTVLYIIWKAFDADQPFYGTDTKNFKIRPYLIMLLIMIPLIAFASTQPDFLAMYPKLKNIQFLSGQNQNGWHKLLYELSYGSDFLSIELFFRGFLVLAFMKYAEIDVLLPMAVFYCTIHFGKPLGECISSFWGGLILGIVTYNTRTIYGGLIVHLGIAWLMELGGYLGNLYRLFH